MDEQFVRNIIFHDGETGRKDCRLIKRNDTINFDLFWNLSFADLSKIDKVFYSYYGTTERKYMYPQYYIEVRCPMCNKIHKVKAYQNGVKRLVRILKNGNYTHQDFLCKECGKEVLGERMREAKKSEILRKEKTETYIKEFLTPHVKFEDYISRETKIRKVMPNGKQIGQLDNKAIKEHVLAMSYDDFLSTKYWDAVRNYKLIKAIYRCQLCNKEEKLYVHHRTYQNHGSEHLKTYADADLIVLCKQCHEKFHNI